MPRNGYKLVNWYFGKEIEIPEEWEKVKLSEECVGKAEYGAGISALEKNQRLPRYIRITDLNDDGSLRDSEWKSISNDDASDYLLNEGDVLFARTGATVGKTYRYRKIDGKCAFAGYLIRFKPDNKNLDSEFLFYLTHSKIYWIWLLSIQTWGVQPNVNAEQYSNMPILLPPFPEQQKIASILSNVDNLIQNTDKTIQQTKRLKKGLMQKILTKGIGHTKFKKANFGGQIKIEIPESWDISTLETISENGTQNGLAISTSDYGSGVPIVGMTKFYASEILTNDCMKEVMISEKNKELFSLKSFDLLFGRRSMDGQPTGEAGKCIIVSEIKSPIIFESSVIRMSIKNEHNPFFIYQFFKSGLGKRIRIRIIRVSAVSGISSGDLKKIKIPLPSKTEQDCIVSILSNVDSKIQSQEQYKEKLERLKKSLMQKLLTGQVRVAV